MRSFLLATIMGFMFSCTPAQTDENSDKSNVDELIRQMTLEEKVHMLHGKGKFTSAGVERLGVPDLKSADGPLGVREEIQNDSWAPAGWNNDFATFFPAGGGLSSTWNLDLVRRYSVAMGEEARAREKDVLLAPAVNLIRSPLGGRNFEYFTEDPFLNKKLVVPFVQGLQANDVASCVKHYAINNQETLRGTIDVQADERTIREMYLPVFEAAVKEGNAYSVMSAYNRFRGAYLSENDYMLNTILRDEWGFKGFVMSDWGAVHSTKESALYGLDIEMGTEIDNYDDWFFSKALIAAVQNGEVPESVIDDKVRNILYVMEEIHAIGSAPRAKGALNTPDHLQVAYEVASESVVLLKNANNALPLKSSGIKSIAVIGDNAKRKHANQGFGAGVKTKTEVTPYDALVSSYPDIKINYAQGYKEQYLKNDLNRSWGLPVDYEANEQLVAEAVAAAQASDVAIVFAGSNRLVETEAEDRKGLRLPFGQEALIKAVKAANPNTIVVIIAGSPHDLSEIDATVDGLVWSWFNGSRAGDAIVDVLFGEVNPSGKLPVTFPKRLEDSPAHATNSFPGGPDVVTYDEGILIGYRWFDTHDVEPFYPFGYGLSYTSFEYSDLKTDKSSYAPDEIIKVSLKVKNTGAVDGKETIQLYTSKPESAIQRAARELKGFGKIALKAGEEKVVSIEIPVRELAFYDVKAKDWSVEPGSYYVASGASSRDLRGTMSFSVE
ncbi:glycoside hydrolase family 3 C-terminal domain-containing protein [Marinoscillum sp.]|uniref:glycoside hydrolase family 3 C-terminal domain-containing protein n=1 Tax=Marinoscillum sp. TaxID=2024838 RepID=UPI003BA90785